MKWLFLITIILCIYSSGIAEITVWDIYDIDSYGFIVKLEKISEDGSEQWSANYEVFYYFYDAYH